MELYTIAAEAFLVLGIGAIVEGRLVPDETRVDISRRGLRFWGFVDVFAGAFALVAMAAGEILAIRVLTASGAAQTGLATRSKSEVEILLAITASYVVFQSLGRRILAGSWHKVNDSAKVDHKRLAGFLIAVISGLAVGIGVLLSVTIPAQPSVVKTTGRLAGVPLLLIVCGILGFLYAAFRCREPRVSTQDSAGTHPEVRPIPLKRVVLAGVVLGAVLVVVGLAVGRPQAEVKHVNFAASNTASVRAGGFTTSKPGFFDTSDGNLWIGGGATLILVAAIGVILPSLRSRLTEP